MTNDIIIEFLDRVDSDLTPIDREQRYRDMLKSGRKTMTIYESHTYKMQVPHDLPEEEADADSVWLNEKDPNRHLHGVTDRSYSFES